MKADWIKRNLVTVVFAIVFAGLMGYSCLRLQQTIARRRQVINELEAERTKFNGLRSSKPFPSADNLNILRENHTRLVASYESLAASLRRPVEFPQYNRVEFAENLAQRLTEMTARVRRAGVEVPALFAFGFDSYLGVLPPAQPEALQLLSKELVVIEKLVDALLACNVEEINRIRRVAVGNTTGPDTLEEGIQTNPKGLYHTTPFEVQFRGSTKALQAFINRLNEMPWLFLVRVVTIDSQTVQVAAPARSAPATRAGAPARPFAPTMPEAPMAGLAPPPSGMIPPGGVVPPGGLIPPGGALPPGGVIPPGAGAPELAPLAPATPDAASRAVEPQTRNVLSVTMRVDLVEVDPAKPDAKTNKPEKPAKP